MADDCPLLQQRSKHGPESGRRGPYAAERRCFVGSTRMRPPRRCFSTRYSEPCVCLRARFRRNQSVTRKPLVPCSWPNAIVSRKSRWSWNRRESWLIPAEQGVSRCNATTGTKIDLDEGWRFSSQSSIDMSDVICIYRSSNSKSRRTTHSLLLFLDRNLK